MSENETFLGSGNAGNSETAQAVEDTNAAKVAPDNADAALTGDKTAVEPGADGKELDVQGLSDEQFEKLVTRIASDSKLPYHKNPAWQRIIAQRNQSTQKAESAFVKYARKDPRGAFQDLLDEGLDEQSAMLKLRELGVDMNEKKEEAPAAEVDDVELMKLFNGMGVKPEQLTQEQLPFYRFMYQFINKMIGPKVEPLNKFVKQTETEKQQAAEKQQRESYEKEGQELSKQVKEKYGMDWDKDCVPEMIAYLQANPKYVGTPKQLFKEVFFDKIEELGKRAKTVEDSKLNDEKKRIKSESGGSSGGEVKPEGVGKNWGTTWKWLESKNK